MSARRRAALALLLAAMLLLSACGSDGTMKVTVRTYGHDVSRSLDFPAATYALNNKTMKFHYPDCASVEKIDPAHLEWFYDDREVLLEIGFEPCAICKP